jgi:transcriptional regulator with XRE-family HTH domain
MSLGERIRSAREKMGYKVYRLSKITNISSTNIVKYEQDDVCPSAILADRIAKALNITVDYLVNGTELDQKETKEELKILFNKIFELSVADQGLVLLILRKLTSR